MESKKFGRLTIIDHPYRSIVWRCRCDCGKKTFASGYHLRNGMKKSCGCLNSEMSAARTYRHGLYGIPEYSAWSSAKSRCVNPKNKAWKFYGGRGIKMSEEWCNDFLTFFKHIGQRPSAKHSLDRIDTNGDYAPGNVRWATDYEQANNQRSNRPLIWDGQTRPRSEWAKITGIKSATISYRIRRGWKMDDVFKFPAKRGNNQFSS